jgi:anti-sigma factor RsiW
MFTCRDVTERASDRLDGRLTLRERLALRAHLALCVHCRRYLRQFAGTVERLRALPTEPVEEATRENLLATFRARRLEPGAD